MRDANFTKKRVELLLFSTPVSLHSNDFSIKKSLHKVLKLMKPLKHFRFKFDEINPSKLAIVINKTNIVFIPSK